MAETISKVLAAHEDLAIGSSTVVQSRGGANVTVRQIELTWILRTIDDIRGLDIVLYTRVKLHQSGEAKEFWFDSGSSAVDDGSLVLRPSSIGSASPGRWLAIDSDADTSFIPLTGTEAAFPITGKLEFEDVSASGKYKISHNVGFSATNVFGFVTDDSDSECFFQSRDTDNTLRLFEFSKTGALRLPSLIDNERWSIGFGDLLGEALIIGPVTSIGGIGTKNTVVFTTPTKSFVFQTTGQFILPDATTAGSASLSAATKGWVDTGLAAKSNTHSHPYLPLAGGTVTGATQFNSNMVLNGAGTLLTVGSLSAGGTVEASGFGTLGIAVSDGRLKKRVKNIVYGLAHVLKLRPISHLWLKKAKRDNREHLSFIAQEIHKVIPHAATYHEPTDTWAYNGIELIPVLTKAIQELEARLREVEDA